MRSSMVPFLLHRKRLVLLPDVGDFRLPASSSEDGDGLMITLDEPALSLDHYTPTDTV